MNVLMMLGIKYTQEIFSAEINVFAKGELNNNEKEKNLAYQNGRNTSDR